MSAIDFAAAGRGDTTEDVFLGGKLNILQPRRGYRAGTDAVLLAAVVGGAAVERGPVLDVGSGVGVAGLCVAARLPAAEIVMIEREHVLAELATENARRNGLADRVSVIRGDITAATEALFEAGVQSESFAVVLANPPFHDELRNSVAENELRARAHAMPEAALDDWARFMSRMAAAGGRAAMIHKADALPRILEAFEGRFGAVSVLPIYAREGGAAIRIIVEGKKGSRAPLSIKAGLVLHGPGQSFQPEVEAIFRHGAPLER